MSTSALTILAVLALFAVTSLAAASETPFVVAHKKASVVKLKSGSERVSVSIDVYNHGSIAIYDVSLSDDSWSSEIFDFVAGNTSKLWEGLDAGSHVSHSFELESKVKTTYYSAPAVVTFRIPTTSKLQEVYSTPIPPLETFAEKAVSYKLDLIFLAVLTHCFFFYQSGWFGLASHCQAKKLLAKYGSHVSVFLIILLFVRVVSTPSSKSSAGNAKKKH